MNKITFWALKYGPIAAGGLMFILPHGGLAQTSTITCTAAPDCASLGYTKSIDQCPDGGMRCPFDQSKMFCVSAENVDFVFKNEIAVGHIVYSDGSTSTSYNANKLPIGIVYYVHQNGKKNHGLIMSIDAPMPRTRAEAILYCDNYVTKGTKVGDWYLPSYGEVWMYSMGSPFCTYTNLNSYLNLVVGGDTIETKYSAFFGYGGANYCNSHQYLGGTCNVNTRSYTTSYHWTSSENFTTTSNQLLPQLNVAFNMVNSNYRSQYNTFRCIAEF